MATSERRNGEQVAQREACHPRARRYGCRGAVALLMLGIATACESSARPQFYHRKWQGFLLKRLLLLGVLLLVGCGSEVSAPNPLPPAELTVSVDTLRDEAIIRITARAVGVDLSAYSFSYKVTDHILNYDQGIVTCVGPPGGPHICYTSYIDQGWRYAAEVYSVDFTPCDGIPDYDAGGNYELRYITYKFRLSSERDGRTESFPSHQAKVSC